MCRQTENGAKIHVCLRSAATHVWCGTQPHSMHARAGTCCESIQSEGHAHQGYTHQRARCHAHPHGSGHLLTRAGVQSIMHMHTCLAHHACLVSAPRPLSTLDTTHTPNNRPSDGIPKRKVHLPWCTWCYTWSGKAWCCAPWSVNTVWALSSVLSSVLCVRCLPAETMHWQSNKCRELARACMWFVDTGECRAGLPGMLHTNAVQCPKANKCTASNRHTIIAAAKYFFSQATTTSNDNDSKAQKSCTKAHCTAIKQETACNTRVLADGTGESKPQVGSRNLSGCWGACGLRTRMKK